MSDLACCVCGRMTNQWAGNPGAWPVPFGHEGGAGQTFIHCGDCCAKMHAEYMIGREPHTVDAIEKPA